VEQLILVRPCEDGSFTARAVTIPEIQATATTEAEAIVLVRQQLTAWLATAKIVKVEVAVVGEPNPWLATFGHAADDPDFEDYLAEIQRYRNQVDEQYREADEP